MRAPQSSAPEPPSQHLRVGEFLVELPAREIRHVETGALTKITVKAQGVLVALALQPGEVVSREVLMDRVWPATYPTGDVLTQAITALRKAFGDDADAPRYVETIAKSGYRLRATVEWLPGQGIEAPVTAATDMAAATVLAAPLRDAAPTRTPALRLAAVALALVAVAGIALWPRTTTEPTPAQLRPPSAAPAPAAPAITPLVIAATPASEMFPRLSPDGSQVAYVAPGTAPESQRLWLQSAMVATPRPLTEPAAGVVDVLPAWSPDGTRIAFQRRGGDSSCQMMVVPASGGEPRRVGACEDSVLLMFDWRPDGQALITGGLKRRDEVGTLYTLDLRGDDAGEWRPLAYVSEDDALDIEPRYSPDGQWIAFRRGIGQGELWRLPAAGGTPERLLRLPREIFGLDWTPDGQALVFAASQGAQSGLFRLDIDSREVTSLGVAPAAVPDVALKASVVTYQMPRVRRQLAVMDIAKPAIADAAVLVSSGNEWGAAASPDGHHLAFYSDRSGHPGLWLASASGPGGHWGEPRLVEDFVTEGRYPPGWSQDGSQLLVVGRGDAGSGLHVVERESLQARRLGPAGPDPAYGLPLGDGLRLVGEQGEDGGHALVLYRDAGPGKAPQRLATRARINFAQVDWSRRRLLFTEVARSSIFTLPLDLSGEPVLLIDDAPSLLRQRAWTLHDGELWVLASQRGGVTVVVRHPLLASGAAASDHSYIPTGVPDLANVMTAGPRPGALVVGRNTDGGHDIGLLRLDGRK